MASQTPKPNTLALSWFFGEHQKGTLILKPKYQRNPIWSPAQQCFLIDSLLSGCPIPQVFLNIKTEGTGRAKTTVYEVVDGQQRLRAITEFISESWALISPPRTYPFSDIYKAQAEKKYSELPESLQNAIWDYQLAVQELRGWGDEEIRAMFRRLNYVTERLSRQELRHSQYYGEFNSTAEELAKDPFWDDIGLFSRRDSARMRDTEFVSELLVVIVDGIQEAQKTLDEFYAKYDVKFPIKTRVVSRFHRVLGSLRTIERTIKTTRFRNRADFYALFAAITDITQDATKPVNLSRAATTLRRLSEQLNREPETLRGDVQRYYSAVVEGPNKYSQRALRKEILLDLLRKRLN
jgi:hypothetical protein